MLIIENDEVLYELDRVKYRNIADHNIISVPYKISYIWYILIALAVFINIVNLLYFKYKIGFHSYLLIGLLILFFRHLLIAFILDDYIHYDIIRKDKNCIYVEYSDVNDFEYLCEKKPKFELFTIIKVLFRYLMYAGFAYYLDEFIIGFRYHSVFTYDFNEIIVSLILTISMFFCCYLSYDFDYSDNQEYLNYSLCCLISLFLFQFSLYQDLLVYFMILGLLCVMFYCLYQSKNKTMLKILIVLFCLFSHYHQFTYHYSHIYHTYYIENGAY